MFWLFALWRNAAAVGFCSSPFGETLPPLDSALRPLAKRSCRWILLFALWRNVPAVGFCSSPFGETLPPLDSARRPLAKRSRRWILLFALWRSVLAVGFSSSHFGESVFSRKRCLLQLAKQEFFGAFEVGRSVDAYGFDVGYSDLYFIAVLQPA